MYIAFNKSNKTLMCKLIKFFTKSEYVHCELVTVKRADKFYGYSAYPGEGVRAKWISYNPNEWEFIKIPTVDVKSFMEKTEGKKYDYLGALGFVFGNNENPNRCKICGKILDYDHKFNKVCKCQVQMQK